MVAHNFVPGLKAVVTNEKDGMLYDNCFNVSADELVYIFLAFLYAILRSKKTLYYGEKNRNVFEWIRTTDSPPHTG